MGAIVDTIKRWWQEADQTQKLITGFGLAFLVIILGFTVFFASRPKMQALYTGLTAEDNSAVYEELLKGGFKVELSGSGGDVMVPIQDVPRAKMALASKNKLPKGKESGLDLINGLSFTDSQVKEREKVLAAKEREFESSIGTMTGVSAATVHLQLGKDSAFNDESAPPSASVIVAEDNSGTITPDMAKSIARLVEHGITNLSSAHISVMTEDGRMLFDGQEQDSVGNIANRKIQAENLEGKRRTTELQMELDKIYGRGNTIAQISVQLDMDATTINTDETVTGTDPLYTEKGSETLDASGKDASGAAGAESNGLGNGADIGGSGDTSKKYTSEAESKQFPSSNTKKSILKAAGDLVAMNVTVTANKTKVDTDGLAALNQRVQSYIAPWNGDPKFVGTVTPVAFNDEQSKIQEKAAADAAQSARMQQLISLMPVGALILVGMILTKSLGKALKKPVQQMVLSNGQTISLPAGTDPELLALIESAALPGSQSSYTDANGLVHRGEEEHEWVEETTGEVDEDGQEVVVKRKKKKKIYDDDDDDDVNVRGIKKKVDVPLEQIKKMAKKNPEAVAMLLKSWVLEERQ